MLRRFANIRELVERLDQSNVVSTQVPFKEARTRVQARCAFADG